MKKSILLLPALLVVAACNQASPPADPSVITSRSAAWEEALNAGDVDTLERIPTPAIHPVVGGQTLIDVCMLGGEQVRERTALEQRVQKQLPGLLKHALA